MLAVIVFLVWTEFFGPEKNSRPSKSSLAPEVLERCAASEMKLSEYCSALIEERRKNLGDDRSDVRYRYRI